MVIVMLIISMLLILIIPNLAAKRNDAQNTADQAVVETIQSEVDMHPNDEKLGKTTEDLSKWDKLTDKQRQKVKDLNIHIDNEGKVISDKVKVNEAKK